MKHSSDVTIDCVHYDMIYQQQAIDARKRFASEYAAVSTRTRTWLDEKLQDRDGFAFAEFIKSGSVQKTQYKRINRKNYDVPIWEITRRFELLRALKTAEGASKEQLSIQCIWVNSCPNFLVPNKLNAFCNYVLSLPEQKIDNLIRLVESCSTQDSSPLPLLRLRLVEFASERPMLVSSLTNKQAGYPNTLELFNAAIESENALQSVINNRLINIRYIFYLGFFTGMPADYYLVPDYLLYTIPYAIFTNSNGERFKLSESEHSQVIKLLLAFQTASETVQNQVLAMLIRG